MKVYFAKNEHGYFQLKRNAWIRAEQNLELVKERGHATMFHNLLELDNMKRKYELNADNIIIEEYELKDPKELTLKKAQILAGWNR